jgi:hypothetical protein
MKPVFLTFAYGEDMYYKFGLKLINEFKDRGYETYICTERDDLFPGINHIPYNQKKFSYHHKILAVEYLYNMGYEKILYMDSDLIINDVRFFDELETIHFEKGLNFTRNGLPENLEEFIIEKKARVYGEKIKSFDFGNASSIQSIWEDILYFNFQEFDGSKFFKNFNLLMNTKHDADLEDTQWERYGDQEGYAIGIACKLSGYDFYINDEFKNLTKFLRAANYSYDEKELVSILTDIDFIFPFRYDSDKRKENLIKVLEYYKTYFWHSGFIVSEQGMEQTVGIDGFNYVFTKKDLPHNQSKCINDGIRLSNKKYVCVVDSDIILLSYHNIHEALKLMVLGELDYSLPYTDCYDLPKFKIRRPWKGLCIGGIFLVDREKFIAAGMNNEDFVGWGREDDERHHRLLRLGLNFKRYGGTIIHLEHPEQPELIQTGKSNLDLLKKITNDNSNFNEV